MQATAVSDATVYHWPREYSMPMMTENVAAILETPQRKTVTRRLLRIPPLVAFNPDTDEALMSPDERWGFTTIGRVGDGWRAWITDRSEQGSVAVPCPWGGVGARVWIREIWRCSAAFDHLEPNQLPPTTPIFYEGAPPPAGVLRGRGRSSLYMPRWAARLIVEVTDVRVERLKQISEDDAIAEGIVCESTDVGLVYAGADGRRFGTARAAYFSLWDHLNRHRATVADNPWVWVIAFRRVEPA